MTSPAIALAPDVGRLALRVRQMLAAGRPAASRSMLRVLRGLEPPAALLAELDGRLAMAEGRADDAIALLDAAIEAAPLEPGLRACRAEAWLRADQPARGLPDAAEAVLLAPQASDAKALLGILLIEVGRLDEAASCLADAVQSEPANPNYRLALAEVLDRLGAHDHASFVLQDGIDLQPDDLALRRSTMLHLVRHRQFQAALDAGEAARRAGIVDASLFGLIGHAQSSLGQHDLAAEAYAEALKLDPADPYVRHLVAASGAAPTHGRAPADYVRVVFDGYADRFETHMLGLGYQVPGLIRAAAQALPGVAGPVTDLGCGTGLLAVVCDDLARPWTGIDLSLRMLAHARTRGLYSVLIEGDIPAVLPTLPQAGLVLAGDVFCYFEALDAVLPQVRAHLRPGGYAIFSVEAMDGAEPHAIRAHGRFAHAEHHVRAAAAQAKLGIVAVTSAVLRHELQRPVRGLIVTVKWQP